jgi:predicted lysophospholipase L1 biosynthesis ABC-type transport system permease subunit
VAAVGGNLDVNPFDVTGNRATLASTVWPAAQISPARLAGLTVDVIVVETNRSTAALEQARTTLELAFPDQNPPQTLSDIDANSTRSITELRQMTDVVIAASLVIAGCSLAVSVTGGVNERKRPFSLLRLTGVPVGVLRRVVALEAAVPLLIISVLSAAMGFLAAGMFLDAQLGYTLRAPGPGYYALVSAGLVASLAIIATTLPLIERITGPEVARNE